MLLAMSDSTIDINSQRGEVIMVLDLLNSQLLFFLAEEGIGTHTTIL